MHFGINVNRYINIRKIHSHKIMLVLQDYVKNDFLAQLLHIQLSDFIRSDRLVSVFYVNYLC